MNERIVKLFMQSVDSNYIPLPIEDHIPSWADKFAELIVRECAEICMEMAAKCAGLPGDGALAKDCADWIKKDFGVKE